MKICITGSNGFLGKHIVDRLGKKYDLILPSSSQYDLREQMNVRSLLTSTHPDIVLHLAGLVGGIKFNKENPATCFYDNAIMGIILMHESAVFGVKKFVQIGSVCSYPKHAKIPFKEDDLWNGYPEETNAPYGMAKKMLLVQGQAYMDQNLLNVQHLLLVNMYGPGDHFDGESTHVVAALIKRFVHAKEYNLPEVTVWGSGNPTREFLYVKDAARAIELALEKYEGREPVNIGSGSEMSISALANIIKMEVGYTGEIVFDQSKPDGQPRRCLDVSRAKGYFGFEATTDFRSGIRETIDWYMKNK